ncbi:nidogen-like domain-containing protein [Sphingomonas sp. 1P06PA]|uniref:nidogen-like domain-containing protein n=1 Tax=Sphingomonas sp. 1P06PA TaxID=554121 RepID=UPI0039A7802C
MSIAADPMRPANRTARASLLASCAVAAALGAQGPAVRAQSYQGTVTAQVNATVSESTGNTTVTVTAPTATIDWTANGRIENGQRVFQDARTTAVFQSTEGNYTVLNRINPGAGNPQIRLDGTTLSYVGPETGGVRGGTVWFYSPGGIALGPNGVIDVGSLMLTANDIAVTTVDGQPVFTDPQGVIRLRNSDESSTASIDIAGQLSAIGEGSYIALVAPRISQAGLVDVNGSAAYVAAQQADIRINGGLFDINIPAGGGSPVAAAGDTVLSHTGTTTGAGSSGTGDNHVTYFVAMPKNNVVSMLVGGSVGYQPVAEGVTVENGVVVLAAGGNIRTNPDTGAAIPVLVDIPVTTTIGSLARLETTTATSRIFGVASDGIAANVAPTASSIFDSDVTLIGGRSASFTVQDEGFASVAGTLLVRSTGITTLLGTLPGTAAVSVSSANLSVGGDLLINASNAVGSGGNASLAILAGNATIGGGLVIQADATGLAGDVQGGTALLRADLIARVNASAIVMTADAIGSNGAVGGNATGGAVTIDAYDTELRVGSTILSANGTGGAAIGGGGGAGTGGTVFVEVDVGGLGPGDELLPGLFNTGSLTATANGQGGGQFCSSGCPPTTLPGGAGTGGTVRILAEAGQITASFIDLGARGTGADGGDVGRGGAAGNGGGGVGGLVEIIGSGGSIDTQFVSAQAQGSGGGGGSVNEVGYGQLEPGAGGNGGVAEGGRVAIDVSAGQFNIGSLFASAGANGGRGGSAETSGSGGNARGGTATIRASGGTITTSSISADTFTSGGGGGGGEGLANALGTGGTALGGTSELVIDSGSIVSSSVFVSAFARGGFGGFSFDPNSGAQAQGAGGDATGGTARMLLAPGATGDFDFVQIQSGADGGFGGVDAAAGQSIGGRAELTSNGGNLSISQDLFVDASILLDGGESGGSDATGGTAIVSLTDGTFDYGGNSLIVRANASGGFDADGDAGGAIGGTATLQIDGLAISLPGRIEVTADAQTGSSDVIRAARGGTASLILTGSAQLQGAQAITVSANGVGGSSPDQIVAPAGSGAGGTARVTVTDSTLLAPGDLFVRAIGTGGNAQEQGAAGAGAGGSASVTLQSADGSQGITTATLVIDASGSGGSAASTFANGVTGGAGGSGSGGAAGLTVTSGTLSATQTGVGAGGTGGQSFNSGPGGAAAGGTVSINIGGTSVPSVDFGTLNVSVAGIGGGTSEDGYGVPAGPAGGSGAGGNATLDFASGTVLASAITVDASGIGAQGGANRQAGPGGAGGVGTGGSAVLRLGGGLTTSGVSLLAAGRGGNGGTSDSSAAGTAGSGAGGTAALLQSGGSLAISEDLQIDARGVAGIGTGAASGTGGTARALLGDGSLALPATLALLASGTGGGTGGAATGGVVEFALQFRPLSLSSLTLDASAEAANGFSDLTVNGGAAQGGTVSLTVANGAALTVSDDTRITAAARGGDASGTGGSAIGGTVNLTASGGSFTSPTSLAISSAAQGGTGSTGGGAATGGQATITLAGSAVADSRIEVAGLSVSVDGTGGGVELFSSSGGNGGAGQGGNILLTAEAGTLAVNGDTTLSALGSGGFGGGNGATPGIGGAGTGGSVTIASNGVILDDDGELFALSGTLDFARLDVNIAGFGGGGSDFGYGSLSGVVGSAGIGGTATFLATDGSIAADLISVQARGTGGNASQGQGALAAGNDGGLARGGAVSFTTTDGSLATGGIEVNATAQAGSASTGATGGRGGNASGGTVSLIAGNTASSFGAVDVLISSFAGNGANGFTAAGGDGGIAIGGSFTAQAGAGAELSLGDLAIGAQVIAGRGGDGGDEVRGGIGGAGGSATGATLVFVARDGGSINLVPSGDGGFDLNVSATGGNGGAGGDGSDFGDAGGIGGHGGAAFGGPIAFNAVGGTITAGDINLVADGFGGSGGGGGTGQTRPFVPGDPGDPDAEPPIPPTPPIPEIPAVRAAGGGSGQGSGGSLLLAASDSDGGEGGPLLGTIAAGFVSASASGNSGQDGDGFFYGGAAGRLSLEARGAATAGAIRTTYLSANLFGFDPGEGSGVSVLADNSLIDVGGGAQVFSGAPIIVRAVGSGQVRGSGIFLFGDSFVDISHDRGESAPEVLPATILADSLFVSASGSIFGGEGSVIEAGSIGLISRFGEIDVDTLRGIDSIDVRAAGNVRIQQANVTGAVFIDDGAESGGAPSLRGGSITVVAGESLVPSFVQVDPLGPSDVTITEGLTATGTIELVAGRDIIIGDGVSLSSDNRINLAAGDDILLAAGSTLRAAIDPIAAPDPGDDEFDGFAGVSLSAGQVPINYQPESGNVASVIAQGLITADNSTIAIAGGTVDARAATISARSLRVRAVAAPAPSDFRSDDGGQLSPDCLQGGICLGTVAITDTLEIGGQQGDDGSFLPTDLSIGRGFDVVSASLRAQGDIRLGFDGGEGSTAFQAGQLLVQSTQGGLFVNGGTTLAGTGDGGTVLLTATGIEASGATISSAGDLGIAAGSGGLRVGNLDVGGSLDTLDAAGNLVTAGELRVATRIDIEDRATVRGSNLRLIAPDGISIGTVTPVEGRSLQLISANGDVVVGDASGNEATLASITISGTSIAIGNADSQSGITLTSTAGDIDAGRLNAASILSLNSAGAILLDSGTAGSFARLRAVDSVNANTIDSAGFVDVDGGAIDIGTIAAGSDVQLDAAGLIRIGQSTSEDIFRATGGELQLGTISVGGDGSEGFGNQDIVATSTGAITLDAGSALDDIFLSAGGAISTGALSAGNRISASASAGPIDIASGIAGGSINVNAQSGAIVTGDLQSGGSIVLRSLTDAITTGSLTAFEDIFVTAAGAADLGLSTAGDDIVIAAASVRSAGAFATGTGPDVADGGEGGSGDGVNIRIQATTAGIELTEADSAGLISLVAGGPSGFITAGDLTAGSFVEAQATSAITFADARAGSDVVLFSDSGRVSGTSIIAGDTISVSGSDVDVTDASAGRGATISAGGTIDFATLLAGGNLLVQGGAITIGTAQAGGSLVANGTTVAIESATTTGLGIGQGEGGEIADASIFVTARAGNAQVGVGDSAADIFISATGDAGSNALLAAGGIDIDADGNVALGTASAGGGLLVRAGNGLTSEGLLEGRTIVSLSAGNAIGVAAADSGGDLFATAGNGLRIGTVTATLAFVAAGGSIDLDSARAGDDIDLTANSGAITAGTLDATGTNTDGGEGGLAGSSIRADAATGITVGRANAASSITLVARGGAIDAGNLTAGGRLSAQAAGNFTSGNVLASTIDIAATGAATILDAVATGGDLEIRAGGTINGGTLRADAGDLRASSGGGVTLASATAGGDLSVSAQGGAISIGGDPTAGGALSLFAADDLVTGDLRANASVAASSRNGLVTLGNVESVGGFVRISAADAIRLGNVRAAGSIFVTGTGTIDAGDLTAGTGPLLEGITNGGGVPGGTDPATAGIAPGFDSFFVPRCDDCFTSAVDLPFDVNYFGQTYGDTFVSNNGYITFRQGQGTFTPSGLGAGYRGLPIIAAFFADVDTRNQGSAQTSYGPGTFAGRNAFGVTYNGVGYFANQADKLNNFQLILTDRADTGSGNFDIYFNYTNISWETGSASGGTNGFGGVSAAVGYNAGTGGQEGTFFELPGSRIVGSFLNGGPAPLIQTTNNGNVGQLLFTVRNGQVAPSGQAEPPSIHVSNVAAPTPAAINLGNLSAEAVEVRGSAAVTVGTVNVGDRGSPIEATGPAFATVIDAQSGLFAGEITGSGFVALGNAAGLLQTGAITTPSSVLVLADGTVELGAVTAGAGAGDSLFVGSQSLLGTGQPLSSFSFGGLLGGSFDPATLAAIAPTAAGATLRLNGPINAGNILLGSGQSLDLTALNATGGAVRTASGGDTLLGGAVTAATDVSVLSTGLIRVNGDVLGNAIGFTSSDIAIANAVTIGRGAASSVSFTNGNPANRMFVGNGGTAGYTIDGAELGTVRARSIALLNPGAQQGGDPDIIIGDLTITGSAATADQQPRAPRLFGENALFSVGTPGRIRVIGDIAFNAAGASDTLALSGGQRVELFTDTGSIRMAAGDTLAGRLVLQASEVFSGSSQAAAAIAAASDLDARSARLAQVDGGLRPEGYLQAGTLEFRVRNALYIQNSGVQGSLNFADRAGFTAGAGGVIIVTTGNGPAAVAINGRQVSTTGFVTGTDLIPRLVVRGSDSQTGSLDPRATANGCLIANVASCVFQPEPEPEPEPEFVPIFFPPVQDAIREALDPDVFQTGEANETAITTIFDLPLIELPSYGTFSFAPLIDEPVTGAGNEDLWGEDDDEDDDTTP